MGRCVGATRARQVWGSERMKAGYKVMALVGVGRVCVV